MWVPVNSGSRSGSCSELRASCCSSCEMPFREWNFSFRESPSEFRELLRKYPGTLPELREWPFHSESVFPEIGVVPRLLKENHEFGKKTGLAKDSSERIIFVRFSPGGCNCFKICINLTIHVLILMKAAELICSDGRVSAFHVCRQNCRLHCPPYILMGGDRILYLGFASLGFAIAIIFCVIQCQIFTRNAALAHVCRHGWWGCTRVKWVPFVLLAFFSCFTAFFASKLAIKHLKCL